MWKSDDEGNDDSNRRWEVEGLVEKWEDSPITAESDTNTEKLKWREYWQYDNHSIVSKWPEMWWMLPAIKDGIIETFLVQRQKCFIQLLLISDEIIFNFPWHSPSALSKGEIQIIHVLFCSASTFINYCKLSSNEIPFFTKISVLLVWQKFLISCFVKMRPKEVLQTKKSIFLKLRVLNYISAMIG